MAEDQHAAKRRRFTSNIATLKVGPSLEKISVHETLLRDNSEFFQGALERKWENGQPREIELATDEINVVTAYVDYLYSKSVKVDRTEAGHTDFNFLAHLYCFGEEILDSGFCDAVMTALLAHIDQRNKKGGFTYPGEEMVNIVYNNTAADSLMRRFLVDMFAQRANSNNWASIGDVPPQFQKNLLDELFKVRPAPGPHGPVSPHLGKWLKAKK
ncbi:hypothetical protein PRZ48_013010 [Zasmidium cellare]|uniref:BTB domain-containing protein n=1 Tax=Zasmidium cellare TaxID=395010 RepID=A0ABR0E2U2_ZASCE|nr:hypothetical protein PRZ48_013010 [Zasmidium cellare]